MPKAKPLHRRRRLELETLESRVCMSATADVGAVREVLSLNTGIQSFQLVRTGFTDSIQTNGAVWNASGAYDGSTVILFLSNSGNGNTYSPLVGTAPTGGSNPAATSHARAQSKTPAAAAPAPNDPAAGNSSEPVVVVTAPMMQAGAQRADDDSADQRSLAATIDEAMHGSSASSAFGGNISFIPSSSSADSSASSLSSATSLADRTLDRLSRLSPVDGPFAAGGVIASAEPIRATEFLAPAAGNVVSATSAQAAAVTPTFANVTVSMVAHTTAAVLSTSTMPSARYFGFTPMGMPAALASDSIAAFAEESASISAGVAVQARAVVFPWAFTFSVIAADLVLLSYIHRRSLRQRLAQTVHWPPAPRPAFAPAV
jgi:hypothetical protein